ncbi:ArsA family ATPase [Myxococcota bacterium]|nr:ArsA family ATPase [Myxococcota bacterium]
MNPLWEDYSVIACVGTGGVGKTTSAAAIGVAAAHAGKKTLIVTIDPARRLAQALGLEGMGNQPRQLEPELFAPLGLELKAELWALMPDVKTTFDELVERTAKSKEQRDLIFNNQIYKHFSTVLAGSHEYAAVEKLYELWVSKRYDFIVLDTPPARNALDFLDAPGRIVDFLENETLRWMLKPYAVAGRFSLKVLDVGSAMLFRTLGKMAGADTLKELADFVRSFGGMYDGFQERSQAVHDLLRSKELAFVLIGSSGSEQVQSMRIFQEDLENENLSVRAMIINRLRKPVPWESKEALWQELRASFEDLSPACIDTIVSAAYEEAFLASRDEEMLKEIRQQLGDDIALYELPEMPVQHTNLQTLVDLAASFPA